jgi:hypothetical protein
MSDKNIIIVAPHPDDEVIGTYEVLKSYKTFIVYDAINPQKRREEAARLRDKFDISAQVYMNTVPPHWLAMKNTVLFFPDPLYERHPLHRQWGSMGEMLARAGQKVVFYNTIMNAPYIHEVENPTEKQDVLDEYFVSQKNMWKYEHKYFLFEGYNSWLFNIKEGEF